MADNKKLNSEPDIKLVSVNAAELIEMDFHHPGVDYASYVRGWKDGCVYKEKALSVFHIKPPSQDGLVN
jgi:hypothetical protein